MVEEPTSVPTVAEDTNVAAAPSTETAHAEAPDFDEEEADMLQQLLQARVEPDMFQLPDELTPTCWTNGTSLD